MNQPPQSLRPPDWRRPRGVASGTWEYANERSIAAHYDAFVADTPLCDLDQQIVAECFPPPESGSPIVLDLGCGTGRSAMPLAARGYRVLGVDLSRPMLETMLEKARRDDSTDGRISAVQANLVDLGCLAANSADHAICLFSTLGMIQGAANRRRFLSHVARITRPGGSFMVHVHHRWAAFREPGGIRKLAHSWWRSLRNTDHEFGDAVYSYRGLNKMFMHRFSRGEFMRDLTNSGWLVERVLRVTIDGSAIARRGSIAGGFIAVARIR